MNITPTISTRLTDKFGLRHPFACAGMAFAGSSAPLAVAVAQTGAIGSFAVGICTPMVIKAVMPEIRRETNGVINLNFITIFTDDKYIDACVESRPEIASFHWGTPMRQWIDRLHAEGISVWEQVGSVDAAKRAVDAGVDAIIIQGAEAGGHNFATLPIFALLPAVIDAVGPHVITLAAGAVSDGRGVAAALALGADGVWVGTRMAATVEADLAPGYKSRLLSAKGEDAVLSSVFGQDMANFNPMRVLKTPLVAKFLGREDKAPKDSTQQPVIGAMNMAGVEIPMHQFGSFVPVSTASGDIDQMALPAGQGVDLINDLPNAGEVVERMMREAREQLIKLGRQL